MIHVVFGIDSKYVRRWYVTATSLFMNNREETFSVNILSLGLTDEDIRICGELCDKYGAKLNVRPINANLLANLKVRTKGLSLATYLRCFMAEVLPAEVEKVLYMDSDIIVRKSIKELWDTPLDGKAVAAVRDTMRYDMGLPRLLQRPTDEWYFNAGMMLINLKYWRENNVCDACMKFNQEHADLVMWEDQDLLNAVLHGNVLFLDIRWNAQLWFYHKKNFDSNDWLHHSTNQLAEPSIIHFTSFKPWQNKRIYPFRNEWYSYLMMTPLPPPTHTVRLMRSIGRTLYCLPFIIGIRRGQFYSLNEIKSMAVN